MNTATFPIIIALSIQFLLGLIVFQSNWHRRANQAFLFLSAITAGWLGCLYFAFATHDMRLAEISIRQASVFGALILLALNFLRVALIERHPSWGDIIRLNFPWLLLAVAVAAFCQTQLYQTGIELSHATGTVMPRYGPYGWTYFVVFIGAGLLVIVAYILDARRATGGARTELTFILIGAIVAVGSALLSVLLGLFVDKSKLVWLAPSRIVLFSLIISYGIATRKIMDVGALLRRVISYAVLATYLIALYAVIWWLFSTALQFSTPLAHSLAHVAAAVVIAFAMAPARGMSRAAVKSGKRVSVTSARAMSARAPARRLDR